MWNISFTSAAVLMVMWAAVGAAIITQGASMWFFILPSIVTLAAISEKKDNKL